MTTPKQDLTELRKQIASVIAMQTTANRQIGRPIVDAIKDLALKGIEAREIVQLARDTLYADDPSTGWKEVIERLDAWPTPQKPEASTPTLWRNLLLWGPAMPLSECPVGLFVTMDGTTLGLKTEYANNEGRIDAYIVESGEFFWGSSPQTIASQREQMVKPLLVIVPGPPSPTPGDKDVEGEDDELESGNLLTEAINEHLAEDEAASLDSCPPVVDVVADPDDSPEVADLKRQLQFCCELINNFIHGSREAEKQKLLSVPSPSGSVEGLVNAVIEAFSRRYYADPNIERVLRQVVTPALKRMEQERDRWMMELAERNCQLSSAIAEKSRLSLEVGRLKEFAEIEAAKPCETKSLDDIEAGCCAPCRARNALARVNANHRFPGSRVGVAKSDQGNGDQR